MVVKRMRDFARQSDSWGVTHASTLNLMFSTSRKISVKMLIENEKWKFSFLSENLTTVERNQKNVSTKHSNNNNQREEKIIWFEFEFINKIGDQK